MSPYLLFLQVLLPGLDAFAPAPLYITVRAFTGCDHTLVLTSDGFVIDPSPPIPEIFGVGENAIEHAQSTPEREVHSPRSMYQTTSSFSSLWGTRDKESGVGESESTSVRIGTYPGGRNVLDATTISDYIRTTASGGAGLPHYVTIETTNRAGLSAVARSSTSVVVDTTPPSLGQVSCTCICLYIIIHVYGNSST